MNRKIFVLAFVSAVFFFGCSADGIFEYDANSSTPLQVKWSKVCVTYVAGAPSSCENLNEDDLTAEDCQNSNGTVENSCPIPPQP